MNEVSILYIIVALIFCSCNKEDSNLVETEKVAVADSSDKQIIPVWGKWILRSGKLYMENLETKQKFVYDHFDSTKTTSSLRYSGAMFDIEVIQKDFTTWSFYSGNGGDYGTFILNDSTQNLYALNITQSNWTIIEHPTATVATMQMGGSARPISAYIDDYDNNLVKFYIQEVYESIDGYNVKYFNELVFQKIESW